VLVLLDGKSTAGETAERAGTLDRQAVMEILGRLLLVGLIEPATDKEISLDFIDFFATKESATPSAAASSQAKKQAAATALLLQQKGYSVRIARRAKSARPFKQDRSLSILVIEDEAHLAALAQAHPDR